MLHVRVLRSPYPRARVRRVDASRALALPGVRGVLHHMDLDAALTQIHRVLAPGGKAIFLEALANNPIIQAYRRRTPQLRTAWETEHILHFEDAVKMRKYFRQVEVRSFHLVVLAAVPLRRTPVFEPVRNALDAIDRAILRVPGIRRQGWMACFLLNDPI
jgi:SAM-dependent methyltransferase